ncbi:MAG TPA: lipid IV(A) 3-deoxy-D-manno-octulosonic acid transferase [Steroidobacteraceae bacterium]|nr:lipid IV(A) 3-deoxy-D-manno-octulosonic acid transferase [Steroidobacteraceae bacterium]
MRLLYGVLTRLAAPLAFAALLARGVRDRAYWAHLGERFGFGRELHASGIWLHAVSLGEVSAAAALLRGLRARHPHIPLVLSTATPTGRAQALALFGSQIEMRFLPYDTPGSMRRFLERIRPRLAIIMETELWPNLLHECRRRGVPVLFASARLTARSVSRYRRLPTLFAPALAHNASIAAQTPEDAERFIAIGAQRARTRVTGNVKFDMQLGPAVAERGRELRRLYLGARPVWTAGSTHEGEEQTLLRAHAALVRTAADALLVLVPRHAERFEVVASLLARQGVIFDRRSSAAAVRPQASVLLADTMGELTALYAASDAAFVGGSLVPVGGHNLLEPAALGVPVITGPYTANSGDIARRLIERGGALEAADAPALARAVQRLMADAGLRERMGAAGREFIQAHRGSVERLLELIGPLLAGDEPAPRGDPAQAQGQGTGQ